MIDRAMILLAALAVALALGPPAPAQQAAAPKVTVKTFVVDPAPAPRPAFRYRLLPMESERTPGDAAPVYLRIRHEQHSDSIDAISEKHNAWIDKPAAEFPVAESRKLVDIWKSKTEQLAFGARRKTCDWAYTLPEQGTRVIEVLLPDAQEMRTWARLLDLKARTEIAEAKYPEAIRTIETGLGFARHVAEGPFLINGVIGIAIAYRMIERAEELASRPGAPNLYWALTALPRPLVGLRNAMETEQSLGDIMVPEIDHLDEPRTEAEWSSLLIRLVDRLNGLLEMLQKSPDTPETATLKKLDVADFKARYLDEAKRALEGRPAPAGPMTDDRALILLIAGRYRELRDVAYRSTYLPFYQGAALRAEAEARIKAEMSGPAAILAGLIPTGLMRQTFATESVLDRRVAALRVVEAIRMHAAANGGKLPATLADVAIVPVPIDPVTGKPFEYRVEGDTAILTAPPGGPTAPGIDHRISIRK